MARKCLYLSGLWLMLCSFSPYSKEKDNIELTEFTKAVISFFTNDSTSWDFHPTKQDIILHVGEDSTCYFLSIEARDKDLNWESLCFDCTITIMGITTYEDYRVYHIGEKNLLFSNAVQPFKQIKIKYDESQIPPPPIIYDPYILSIPINKEMLTFDIEKFLPEWHTPFIEKRKEPIRRLCEKYITPKQSTL